MKFFGAVMGAAALLAAGVTAQYAQVTNDCDFTVYVQSFPYDGSAPGNLTAVRRGRTYSEAFQPYGSTIKIDLQKTFPAPLFFGYSFSTIPNYVYYEFNTQFGNPFAQYENVLTPGDGCQDFDCDVNATTCYSIPHAKKIYGCPQPVNLTAILCL
ncbi:hypothetical protein F4777DRAFT_575922 [Nemania sp. FL0916]|nr:hypothetical protein F4777DRAFT_575922 [Nemania sp. FL0916]